MFGLETKLCFSSARNQEGKSWSEAIAERGLEKSVPEKGRKKRIRTRIHVSLGVTLVSSNPYSSLFPSLSYYLLSPPLSPKPTYILQKSSMASTWHY